MISLIEIKQLYSISGPKPESTPKWKKACFKIESRIRSRAKKGYPDYTYRCPLFAEYDVHDKHILAYFRGLGFTVNYTGLKITISGWQ